MCRVQITTLLFESASLGTDIRARPPAFTATHAVALARLCDADALVRAAALRALDVTKMQEDSTVIPRILRIVREDEAAPVRLAAAAVMRLLQLLLASWLWRPVVVCQGWLPS